MATWTPLMWKCHGEGHGEEAGVCRLWRRRGQAAQERKEVIVHRSLDDDFYEG